MGNDGMKQVAARAALAVSLLLAASLAEAVLPPGTTACSTELPSSASSQPSVHVLLSPRMPYALKEWSRMADLAGQAGFRILTYRDPRVSLTEWQSAVNAEDLGELRTLPPLDLDIARACDMLNHAPTAIVARCGHTHPWPLRGVMNDRSWRHVLDARLSDLEALPCP